MSYCFVLLTNPERTANTLSNSMRRCRRTGLCNAVEQAAARVRQSAGLGHEASFSLSLPSAALTQQICSSGERKAGRYYRSQEITDVSTVSSFCEPWFWVPKGEIKQTSLVSRTSVEQLQANVILDSFNSLPLGRRQPMERCADWALPRGSFLAATQRTRERIKLRLFGCFLPRSNEGIKTASARII
ncbi:hypothetical protein NQZ68_014897 [Dissostichus eleginoides]|nr:hypothetical protein NQZ68_014897 [Dissostichus eleginoides]